MGTTAIEQYVKSGLNRDTPEGRAFATRNLPKTRVTPEYRDYLSRQIANMAVSGSSEADLLAFLQHEGIGSVPKPVVPEEAMAQVRGEPTTMDMGGTMGTIRGLSMRALQGITFGFGDEALGAIIGKFTGIGARQGIEDYRNEMRQWSSEHKKLGFAAEIGGALITGGPIARGGAKLLGAGASRAASLARAGGATASQATMQAGMRAAPTVGQRIAVTAGQGIAAGGVSGAGHGEGGLSVGGLSDRAKSALLGASIGGAFGAALIPAGRLAGSLLRPAARSVTRGMAAIQKRIPGVGTPEQHARELLYRSLAQDGIDIDEAITRAIAFERSGTPASIADIGGESTLQLAVESASGRTPVKQRLVEMLGGRQAEQGDRLMGGMFARIFRGNKLGLRNAYEAEEVLLEARKLAARPHYEAAFEEVAQVSPRMQQLLQHPQFKKAWAVGRKLSQDEDLAGIGHGLEVPLLPEGGAVNSLRARLVSLGFPEERIAAEMANVGKLGQEFPTELPVRGLDYMKRGLDRVIAKGMERGSLDARGATTLRRMRNEVLDEADAQVPAYAQARAIFKGFSDSHDALTLGREYLKKAPALVSRELRGLSVAERDFYRLGAAQALYDKVMLPAQEGSDVARRFFGGSLFGRNNLEAQRIRALFPDAPDVADDLMRQVAGEARVSHTSARARGARPKGSGVKEGEGVMEGAELPNVRASAGIAVLAAGRQVAVRARTGWTNDVSDELAILFSKGIDSPSELGTLLEALRASGATLGRRSTAAGRTAVGIGEAAGQIQ